MGSTASAGRDLGLSLANRLTVRQNGDRVMTTTPKLPTCGTCGKPIAPGDRVGDITGLVHRACVRLR